MVLVVSFRPKGEISLSGRPIFLAIARNDKIIFLCLARWAREAEFVSVILQKAHTFNILSEYIGGQGCRKQNRTSRLLVKDGATSIENPGPYFASGDLATRTSERLTTGRAG